MAGIFMKIKDYLVDVVVDVKDKTPGKIPERIARKIADKIVDVSLQVLTVFVAAVYVFLRKVPGILCLITFSQVGDKSVISDDGCPTALIKSSISQLNFIPIDFSSSLDKREGFVGREWFFEELQSIFNESLDITGVLITGEPGSGKSALISQLICSPVSNLLIHDNIIGYHLCDYSEAGKRDGARFVRNLVDQIAARLPEYEERVKNNERLRKQLNESCHQHPIECFYNTIVGPLNKMKSHDDKDFRFIIIDALDECFESDRKTSRILDILKSKLFEFPSWLKIILTSRNLTSVTSKLPLESITWTSLNATDERNVKDIRDYASRFIPKIRNFFDRLLTDMNFRSSTDRLKVFLDKITTQADGNFLFVKMVLKYIKDTDGKADLRSIPNRLSGLYEKFFEREFNEVGLGPFRFLFEVLLAAYSPLQSEDVEKILESEYEAADSSKRMIQVSSFLRYSSDEKVRIYHRSFADWLINKANVYAINITRGHHSIAKFLFLRLRKRHMNVTFEGLSELFMHILSGNGLEMQATALELFNITKMRESQTNQTILHYLVTRPNIYLPVLHFFLKKFETADVLDSRNKTPAFYAASEGVVWSLQSCINSGADVSSFLEGQSDLVSLAVLLRNTGIEELSLMHTAAAEGHTDVVELLITTNISFPDSSNNYPTPLHLAAGNGHLEVVKLFYNYGSTFDAITLHHAAARNHLAVVEFLLSTVGLRDTCLQCEPNNFTQLSQTTTMQEVHSYFCETALHAAVSRGLVDMVKILLASGKEALECKHHSGKTVLIDTVERNHAEIVDLLLKHGANVKNKCGLRISVTSKRRMCSTYSMYEKDFVYAVYCDLHMDSCDCGNTAVHVSAKYGLWKIAKKLTNGRIYEMLYLKNCDNESAIDVAVK